MFFQVIEVIALGLEALGVLAILVGFSLATVRYLKRTHPFTSHEAYIEYRHGMGRSILLGLDFLIAGDIIKTVIVAEVGMNILVLVAIVLIRTFLSMTLHLEVEGHWPWQKPHKDAS